MKVKIFKTGEEYRAHANLEEKKKLNEREYAKQHPSEKVHYIFHGGCLNCVTPLHYGIGNCTGCKFYNGVTSNYPELKIENFLSNKK